MKASQFSPEQIIKILQQAERGEQSIGAVCRAHGIAETTFYRWRKQYGGLTVAEVQRVGELEKLPSIAEELRAIFPDLGVVTPLRLLGAGFHSVAVETSGGLVFRIAKNDMAAEGHAKEMLLLPTLRPHLPIPVPNPQWYIASSAGFPFGVIGYPRLPGTPLLPELLGYADVKRIAADVAAFLFALHRFPSEAARARGLPESGLHPEMATTLRDEVLPPLRDVLTTQEYRPVARWWASFLSDRKLREYTPVVHHGDLWYENILVDDTLRAVVGILDFEDAAVGDLAQDFATQLHLGVRFTNDVIAAYRTFGGALDAHFDYRVRRHWELRAFCGIQFAVRFHDQVEFEDSIRKLRSGPILNPHARY